VRMSLIVAMDLNGLIGSNTGLPWRLSADLRRFRKLTTGKPIILGRKTLEQIGGPLKDRHNIVLTRQTDFQSPGCTVVSSLDAAIRIAECSVPEMKAEEIMVIGGADIYRQALPLADRLYLTIVNGRCAGNVHFPFGANDPFRYQIVHDETLPADANNEYGHRFLIADRASAGKSMRELVNEG
jgi:dihydrofolate reductase